MSNIKIISFNQPYEVKEILNGRIEIIRMISSVISRATFEPGWRWSTSLKFIDKTDSCLRHHFQYHVSGVLKIRMDNGKEITCKPGDFLDIPPGHDAWVEGNEPVVVIDFQDLFDSQYIMNSLMEFHHVGGKTGALTD